MKTTCLNERFILASIAEQRSWFAPTAAVIQTHTLLGIERTGGHLLGFILKHKRDIRLGLLPVSQCICIID